MTCWAFIFPVLLAQKGQAGAAVSNIAFHVDVMQELFAGNRLSMFVNIDPNTARGWIALIPRLGLLLIVPGVPVLLAGSQASPAATATEHSENTPLPRRILAFLPQQPAARLLAISLIYLASTVFFPRSLNNSYFFPQRMWDIVWPLILAFGAAAPLTLRVQQRLAAAGLGLIVVTAWIGAPLLTSIARAQQRLAQAPLPAGGRGLFLEPDSAEEQSTAGLTYPVYAWSGARAFAASHAILLNSPWLELTISPLRDTSGPPGPDPLLDRDLPSFYGESPLVLTRTLVSPAVENIEFREHGQIRDPFVDRASILARADFFLYSNPASIGSPHAAEDTRAAALALLGPESAAWRCEAHGFYVVCVRIH